jgi:hypothetical protein
MARSISMGARREVLSAVAERYRLAGRVKKGRILDALCRTTGWHRKHAVRALRQRVVDWVVEMPAQRERKRRYGAEEKRMRSSTCRTNHPLKLPPPKPPEPTPGLPDGPPHQAFPMRSPFAGKMDQVRPPFGQSLRVTAVCLNGCSPSWSRTIRTARPLTSPENPSVALLIIALSGWNRRKSSRGSFVILKKCIT